MAAKTIISGESSRMFGVARLANGTYTIKSFARFKKPCDTSINKDGEYEVIALFIDDTHDECLELNGCWRARRQVESDGKVSAVKAGGTLFDRIFAVANRKTFDKACEALNAPEAQLIWKQFKLEWQEYVPANSNSAFGYVPKADII